MSSIALTLFASCVPPLVLGGLLAFALQLFTGPVPAIIVGIVFATFTLWAEVLLLVTWMGKLYAYLDPVEAGLLK